ncbi:MAG TPA: hypothetical protein VFC67_20925 [Prolixibacteraceae bacterium]|nr:hypothetical protein [Prolixibacteraceae bacterium]
MDQISRVERTTTTIVGKIGDVLVNINYEQKTGEQPQNINAGCNLPTAEGMQPVYINISRQGNGQTSVSVNGNKDVTEVAVLIEAIKTELEIIAAEGVVA